MICEANFITKTWAIKCSNIKYYDSREICKLSFTKQKTFHSHWCDVCMFMIYAISCLQQTRHHAKWRADDDNILIKNIFCADFCVSPCVVDRLKNCTCWCWATEDKKQRVHIQMLHLDIWQQNRGNQKTTRNHHHVCK